MRCLFVFIYVVYLFSDNVCARVFDTRCKLVREMMRAGIPNDIFLGQWVCLIEQESKRDTSVYTETPSGKKYYGLYQIPSRWCRPGKKGGDCNIKCESLLDDDIRDDTACAVTIFHKEGFQYWNKWSLRCKNNNFITNEIWKCPDLINYREQKKKSREQALVERREKLRLGIQRYIGTTPNNFANRYLNVGIRGNA